MIRRLRLYEGTGFDPHYNLAVEQHLLETVAADCCVLYLWQNRNTVVIGRNQNAWKECRAALLEAEGGRLARRLSGGGAVYHDLGNLNFTFLLPSAEYDLTRQTGVILRACRALGLPAEASGRNDLLADGRKFSGSAFYHHEGRSCHHGTLLVDADMEKLGRYLRPSEAKLKAKGVESVRARVVNLRELKRELTVETLRAALRAALGEAYALPVETMRAEDLDGSAVNALYERNRSWAWNYGRRLPFDFTCEKRFPWGELRLELAVEGGVVRRAAVYTDAMDWTLAPALEAALAGCRFDRAALSARAGECRASGAEDAARLLAEQDI